MENLFEVYIALAMSSVILAVTSVLIPSLKIVKPHRSALYTFCVLYVILVFATFPFIIWEILVNTKEAKQSTVNSLRKVVNIW